MVPPYLVEKTFKMSTAFQQHNMRRAYSKLNQATPEEVLASKKRESALILDSMGLAPVGQGWGNEVMQELRAIRANQHANHQANQASQRAIRANQRANHRAIQARMDRMLVLLSQNTNRTHVAHETIVQVPNNQGEMPPDHLFFPLNEVMITSMEEDPMDALLNFYGIEPEEGATTNHKKSLLSSHLGLQRLADTLQ